MTKIRASKLRNKPEPELQKQLGELKTELGNLRLYRVTRGASYHGKLKKIRTLRKSIARVYTVIHQAQKLRQREAYRSKKYVPKDLRPKKTRAIRRRLSKKEQSIHSARSMRKARAFPPRVFASLNTRSVLLVFILDIWSQLLGSHNVHIRLAYSAAQLSIHEWNERKSFWL
ncbi:unnamed protein product [Schistosoma curassoni]|nr:unnamed protein product [Schistosoma curassoni]